MPINIKNYLREKLASADPTIDAQSGTGVGDLLVDPLAKILEDYDVQNENLIAKFSKINIEDLTNELQDKLSFITQILQLSLLIMELLSIQAHNVMK